MDKMHARHCHASIEGGGCALEPRRPPAELGH
jgi:hypothetical protein